MKPDSGASTTILAILPSSEDQAFFRNIVDRPDWNLHFARSFREAQAALREARTGVVISECCLPDGRSWKDLLDELETLANPPPLIVASRLADDRLWAEVLNLGCYDLLVKPFDATEVLRVVTSAWLAWKREWPERRRCENSQGARQDNRPGRITAVK